MQPQKVMPYTWARQAVIAVLLVIQTAFAFSATFTVYCNDGTTDKKLGKAYITLGSSQAIISFATTLSPTAATRITPVAGLPLLTTMFAPPGIQYFIIDETDELRMSFHIVYAWQFSLISVQSLLVSNEPTDSGDSFFYTVMGHPQGASQFSGTTTYATPPQSLWTLLYRLLKQSKDTFQTNVEYKGVQVVDHFIAHSATGRHFYGERPFPIPTEWTIQSITHVGHTINILFEPDIEKVIPELTVEFDDAWEGRSTVSRIKSIQYKLSGRQVVLMTRDEMNVAQVPPPCLPSEQTLVQSSQYPPPPPPGAGGVTAIMPFVMASGLVTSKANQ